jgi:hypothetical protein
MRNYDILIKLKDNSKIDFKLECEKDVREELKELWRNNTKGILHIGDYFISAQDILYIKIEGENIGLNR